MRFFFHVTRAEDLLWSSDGRYAPASLEAEGFVHASFRDVVKESARLYFAGVPEGDLRVLVIDPRRLDVRVEIADTPRGPMPHLHGALPRDAVRMIGLNEVDAHADHVTGTRIAFAAFEGMTLLDLVGPLDALGRIASMGFDPEATTEIVALTPNDDALWNDAGAELRVASFRPDLAAYDVLVVPGGKGTRVLETDRALSAYLATFPANRITASVCTGALLLGAAGRLRGKRATTHASEHARLAEYGAMATKERVVTDGQLVTSGGVTAGIDLGLALVERLCGAEFARKVATQMEAR